MSISSLKIATASHPATGSADAGHSLDTASHSLDLGDFFRILRQQAALIALLPLAAMLLGLAYAAMTPSRFTASSNILINPQPKRVFNTDFVPQDGNTNQILIESQTRVIASNAVLERVVDAERLADDEEFAGAASSGPAAFIRGLIGSAPAEQATADERRQAALRSLLDRLAVKRPSQTYVVEVAVTANDAEKAARLSRAIAEAYIADQAEAQAEATRQTSLSLQDRLTSLRQRVLEADSRVQEFKEKHDIVAAEGALVNERHLSRLNDELAAARERVGAAEARFEKVRRFIATGTVPETIDEAVNSRLISSLREQFARTARRESQLATVYGERHPQLIAARAEVDRTRSLIHGELARLAGSMKTELDVEQRRVATLQKRIEASRNVTDLTNKARVELASLEQDANASRAIYDRVLAKAREASTEEKLNMFDARVISYATAPLWASWPKKSVILPLALLLGLGLGVTGALVNDYRQDRFASLEHIERDTGLRLIAAIPHIDAQLPTLRQALLGKGSNAAAEGSFFRLHQELGKVGSPYASAVMGFVRRLQTQEERRSPHSVMLVSASESEGSSSLAWSAAVVAAMQNKRVLLIDGDGGNGDLSRSLAPRPEVSLRDVLAGSARFSQLVVKDPQLGISFLPLVAASGAAEAINWRDYQSLLQRLPALYADYDLVIVDGGAVLKSGLAHLLIDLVDDVALVIRSDETRRATVREARQALGTGARKLSGVVASMVDPAAI